MTPGPGIEPGTHWWEALSPLHQPCTPNFFGGFIYIKHIAGLVVENYSKSLQELEGGIIHVQLVPLPKKQEVVSHPVNE